MNTYNLSNNYGVLFEFVKSGNVAVGFVDYTGGTLRDVVKIFKSKIEPGINIGCRGIQYGGTHDGNKEAFVEECHRLNLEWIEP